MDKVVDELGLVRTGEFLTAFLPATGKAFVFRVKARVNQDREVINYGSIPLVAGESLPTYEAASTTVPADGVIPARAYTGGKTFPMAGAYDEGDMWYVPEDYRDRLFHVLQYVTPAFLRLDVQVPTGVTQGRFQKDKIVTGVDKDFGFSRGFIETVHVPKLRYGYRYGNDTNINLFTFVKFVYGEYIVEIPKNSSLIFDVLTRRIPSHWVTMPINISDPAISRALTDTYGVQGFTVYRIDQKETAVREFESLLKEAKI